MAPTIDIPGLVSKLTLEEKVSLVAGKNFWETQEIPRLSIPSLKVSDGPNGARGSQFQNGVTAACFPASVSLAATFDVDLARKVGKALAEETLTKGARVLLGPTVCPHRHPLGGRNFESFSEDPRLAGKLASQYIQGLQENGVGATIKHFAVNEQETNRFTTNAIVSEKALREIYLKPFEIAIKEAKPWAVMTSYNLVNGTHSDSNEFLLKTVLKENWGWEGLVMSDWGGTNSVAESLKAGLALEMPGPARQYKIEAVKAAIKEGKLSEETINERVTEVLNLLVITGKFEHPETSDEEAIVNPEHKKLIREGGAHGIVLLKNEGNALPLQKDKLKKVAVLGLAKQCLAHGGGSAAVNAHYRITPYDALQSAFGGKTELLYAEGARLLRNLPTLSSTDVVDKEGKPGFTVTKYSPTDLKKIESVNIPASIVTAFDERLGAATIEGTYKPSVSGNHYLELSAIGPASVFINDKQILDIPHDGADPMAFLLGGAAGEKFRFEFEAGKEYRLKIESKAPTGKSGSIPILDGVLGVNLGLMHQQEFEEDVLDAAIEAAKSAETALVFVGNTNAWETEGRDMDSMDLPADGSQDRLINAVADVNPNTIVINSTGVAIAMPWLHKVKAVLQTWFPGQEAGNSIVDVLTGTINPSGRLPATFPRSLKDTPAYGNFPGDLEKLEVNYEEGSFIGYRHYDHHPEAVLFPFGFGLSYTTFKVGNAKLTWGDSKQPLPASSKFVVVTDVTNTGSVAGSEVLQVYVTPLAASNGQKTQRQLVGFAKVELKPEESKEAHISFEADAFAEFEEDKGQWLVAAGQYKVEVATSASKKDVKADFTFTTEEDYLFRP